MDGRYWHLALQLAVKDFKIRYTSSLLGYAWSVLNPLVFALIYFLVFSVFIRFDVPFYAAYLLLGVVLWTYFAEATSNGVTALLARAGLLSKVALPRQVVIYAALLNALMTFAISLLVLAGLLVVTGTPRTWALLAFPLQLVNLVALTLGVSLLLSPLHVRFHDVGYLWGIFVQVGFWLTPIIYRESMVPDRWRWLLKMNPMARIIEASRMAVIFGVWPSWAVMGRTTLMVALVLGAGVLVFRRLQARVVEYF
jgi:homopolymeric O-antigen transport system permease protein